MLSCLICSNKSYCLKITFDGIQKIIKRETVTFGNNNKTIQIHWVFFVMTLAYAYIIGFFQIKDENPMLSKRESIIK